MIIAGYPGIGKSTYARNIEANNVIDLESSNFDINGKKPENWEIYYCNIAEDLSRQGNLVFVSSHQKVRDRLRNSNENKAVMFPALELSDVWRRRLGSRYGVSRADKDKRAWYRAINHYDDDIKALMEDTDFCNIIIKDINYKIEDLIEELYNIKGGN